MPWPNRPLALPLLLAHGLAMSLPVAPLRPQVVPVQVRAWLQALPVPPNLELRTAPAWPPTPGTTSPAASTWRWPAPCRHCWS